MLRNVSLCQLKEHHSLYESYVPMRYKRYYKKMKKYVYLGNFMISAIINVISHYKIGFF